MKKLAALLPVIFVVLLAGCIGGFDASSYAQGLTDVQSFMAEHPGASVTAALWESDVVAGHIEDIRLDCGGQMEVTDYWRVVAAEGDNNVIVWIDAESQEAVCIIKSGVGQPSQLPSVDTCSDGTSYNSCSSIKPKYCDRAGNLIYNCPLCGCLSGKVCDASSGYCVTPEPSACADGTANYQCSSTKPKKCLNGELVDVCSVCGCPSGMSCQADGTCALVTACSDGTPANTCSSNTPLKCVNGQLTAACGVCGCSEGYTCRTDGTCESPLDTCYDGTDYSACSVTKPKYCDANTATLIDKCSVCGCAEGYTCQDDETCKIECSDETLANTCSLTPSTYCDASGDLVEDCTECGCETGYTCNTEETRSCYLPEGICNILADSLYAGYDDSGKVTLETGYVPYTIINDRVVKFNGRDVTAGATPAYSALFSIGAGGIFYDVQTTENEDRLGTVTLAYTTETKPISCSVKLGETSTWRPTVTISPSSTCSLVSNSSISGRFGQWENGYTTWVDLGAPLTIGTTPWTIVNDRAVYFQGINVISTATLKYYAEFKIGDDQTLIRTTTSTSQTGEVKLAYQTENSPIRCNVTLDVANAAVTLK